MIAADLLSQAEHDENAQSVLITDNVEFAQAVEFFREAISMFGQGGNRQKKLGKKWSYYRCRDLGHGAGIGRPDCS